MIFLAALAFDTLGRRSPLPRVTLLLLFGVAVGPAGLALLPASTTAWYPTVADMALLMLGFLLGGQLTRTTFREQGRRLFGISLAVAVGTLAVVGGGLIALGLPAPVALLLAAIATATDPAASADVVHESAGETRFSRTLLAIVALDDVYGLVVFSIALALGMLLQGDGAWGVLLSAGWELGGALALGLALGVPMAFLTGRIEPGEPTLYEALGLVFLCGGLAHGLGVSFLLAALCLGATVANLARHHTRPFHAIEGIEWPFLTVFFVLAGASLEIGTLAAAGRWLAIYCGLRLVGRLIGGWLAGSLPPAEPALQRWLGMALLPQAGVAVGMALVASERFPEVGEAILPVVVASTVLFELVGPVATRFALERSRAAEP